MQQGCSSLPCFTAPSPSSKQSVKAHLHDGTALIRETCVTNAPSRQRSCSAHSITAGAGSACTAQKCVVSNTCTKQRWFVHPLYPNPNPMQPCTATSNLRRAHTAPGISPSAATVGSFITSCGTQATVSPKRSSSHCTALTAAMENRCGEPHILPTGHARPMPI